MDAELLSQARRVEIEREVAYLRVVAAAKGASREDQRAVASAPVQRRAAPALAVRLLRALM